MFDELIQNDSPKSNLETLLTSLFFNANDKEESVFPIYYHYAHDLISFSNISNFINCLLWILIIIIIDTIIVIQVIPFDFFSSLSSGKFLNDPSSRTYIFSELTVQQLSFITILITIFLMAMQLLSIQLYQRYLHLSSFYASFFYFVNVHFPLLITPICGTLFGTLILATYGNEINNKTSIFYAIALSSCYLIVIINYSISTKILRGNLLIGNSKFSFYYHPFNISDLIYIFLISGFYVFRETREKEFFFISSVISILWGIKCLAFKQNFPFLSIEGNLFYLKLPIDAISFGVLSFISAWIQIPNHVIIYLFSLFYFFGIIISGSTIYISYKILKNKFSSFDSLKIVKASQAANVLRNGVLFHIKNAIKKEFLQWLISHYCKEEIIPDIVRICIAFNYPLSSMPWNKFSLSPSYLISLKFLSYQYQKYMKYECKDQTHIIEKTLLKLRTQKESFLNLYKSSHRIIKLGTSFQNLLNQYRYSIIEFPQSPEIKNEWTDFQTYILNEKPCNIYESKNNMLYMIQSLFSFSLKTQKFKKNKKKISSAQKYLNDYVSEVIKPYVFWIRLSFICFFGFVFLGNIQYSKKINFFSRIFTNIGQLLYLVNSLSSIFLRNIDELIVLPPLFEISKVLGISEQDANTFKLKFNLTSEEMNKCTSFLYLLDNKTINVDIPGCSYLSLTLITTINSNMIKLNENYRCYAFTTEKYLNFIAENINNRTAEVVKELNVSFLSNTILLGVFVPFFTVCFYIFLYRLKKRQNKILKVMKKIHLGKYDIREPGFYFSVFYASFLWFVTIILTILLFIILEIQINNNSKLLNDDLTQMDIISDIASNSMIGMGFSELSYLVDNEKSKSIYEERAKKYGEEVINSVLTLKSKDIISVFKNIDPLNRWSLPDFSSLSTLLIAYGRLLNHGELEKNQYRFLMQRYIMMSNISILANNTIEDMMAESLFQIQNKASLFWLTSICFLILSIIVWIIFEINGYYQNKWFFGIKFLMRKEILGSPQQKMNLLQLIETDDNDLIQKLPFPAMVISDLVVNSNVAASSFFNKTTEQVIGQNPDSLFIAEDKKIIEIFDKTIKLNIIPFNYNYFSLIKIDDLTQMYLIQSQKNQLITNLRSEINDLPLRTHVYYISVEFNVKKDSWKIDLFIRSIESRYPNVKRISIGLTYYKAIALDNDYESVMRFAFALYEQFQNLLSISVVEGECLIASIYENNIITFVGGKTIERGDFVHTYSKFGCIYVDASIQSMIQLESPCVHVI